MDGLVKLLNMLTNMDFKVKANILTLLEMENVKLAQEVLKSLDTNQLAEIKEVYNQLFLTIPYLFVLTQPTGPFIKVEFSQIVEVPSITQFLVLVIVQKENGRSRTLGEPAGEKVDISD